MLALEQTSEILLKLGIGCGGRGVPRNQHNIVPAFQWLPMRADNFAYAPAKKIAHHGVAQPFRCNNPESGFLCARTLAGIGQGAEHKKTPCCG